MKTIGINIDGILRDSFTKFDDQYRKVFIHNPSIVEMNEEDMSMREFTPEEIEEIDKKIEEKERDLLTLPMDSPNFLNHYKFEEKIIEMTADNFIMHEDVVYEDAPQEPIVVSPDKAFDNFLYEDYALQIFGQAEEIGSSMNIANRIQSEGLESGKYNVVLLSTCKRKAVPATYSFLALKNCRIKKLIFVEEDYQKWDHCDLLIDISPEAIQSKPSDKKVIKINNDFNKWDEADLSFDNIRDLRNSESIFDLIDSI